MLKQKNPSTTPRRRPFTFLRLIIFNLRRDLVWLSLLILEAARRQYLPQRKWGVHPLRIYRSTAATTLHLCHVVSFELHDVRPFRAIRRNLDPN